MFQNKQTVLRENRQSHFKQHVVKSKQGTIKHIASVEEAKTGERHSRFILVAYMLVLVLVNMGPTVNLYVCLLNIVSAVGRQRAPNNIGLNNSSSGKAI